jgi:hypothetical protein
MLDELIRNTIREMVERGGPPVAFLSPKGDRDCLDQIRLRGKFMRILFL